VKPGATEFDAQGRIVGTLDVPLNDSGILQAQSAAAELSGLGITAIYSGPSLAAQQTAVEITANSRVRPRVDAKLKNVDMGLWQGRELEELKSNQPRFVRQWQDNPENVCPPEGETLMDARPRVDAFLKRISRKHKSGVVVVVVADPLAGVIATRIDMLDHDDNQPPEEGLASETTSAGKSAANGFGRLQSFSLSAGFTL
jgi:broad specificity phosphatase PhoE